MLSIACVNQNRSYNSFSYRQPIAMMFFRALIKEGENGEHTKNNDRIIGPDFFAGGLSAAEQKKDQ